MKFLSGPIVGFEIDRGAKIETKNTSDVVSVDNWKEGGKGGLWITFYSGGGSLTIHVS